MLLAQGAQVGDGLPVPHGLARLDSPAFQDSRQGGDHLVRDAQHIDWHQCLPAPRGVSIGRLESGKRFA